MKYLAKILKLNFSKLENDVLDTFREIIEWKGRYPIPLDVDSYKNSDRKTFGKLLNEFSNNEMPKEIESILKILDELYSS